MSAFVPGTSVDSDDIALLYLLLHSVSLARLQYNCDCSYVPHASLQNLTFPLSSANSATQPTRQTRLVVLHIGRRRVELEVAFDDLVDGSKEIPTWKESA
ncbi:hypothetical protein J1614_002331 [Plenodomus biglobosus]|nr:hypothetical protein J1614_002331 [Plenodomus biglobosus]